MVQKINQFAQKPEKGQVDLHHGGAAISVLVDTAQATPLVPGQAVKLVDSSSKMMTIVDAANATSKAHGVVLRNNQKSEFEAYDACEIGINGAVVQMEASAAIARGASVAYSATGAKVATAVATNVVLGVALDKALADGDIIRVMIAPLAVTETL